MSPGSYTADMADSSGSSKLLCSRRSSLQDSAGNNVNSSLAACQLRSGPTLSATLSYSVENAIRDAHSCRLGSDASTPTSADNGSAQENDAVLSMPTSSDRLNQQLREDATAVHSSSLSLAPAPTQLTARQRLNALRERIRAKERAVQATDAPT